MPCHRRTTLAIPERRTNPWTLAAAAETKPVPRTHPPRKSAIRWDSDILDAAVPPLQTAHGAADAAVSRFLPSIPHPKRRYTGFSVIRIPEVNFSGDGNSNIWSTKYIYLIIKDNT